MTSIFPPNNRPEKFIPPAQPTNPDNKSPYLKKHALFQDPQNSFLPVQDLSRKMLSEFAAQCEWVGIRALQEVQQNLYVRNGQNEAPSYKIQCGVMIEVFYQGHFGYAGTSDLTPEGLRHAFQWACQLAKTGSTRKVFPFNCQQVRLNSKGEYRTLAFQGFDSFSYQEMYSMLNNACKKMKSHSQVVSQMAFWRLLDTEMYLISSSGLDVYQKFLTIGENLSATAQQGAVTQTRTENGYLARCLQTGLEWIDPTELYQKAERIGQEAVALLSAPECPSETTDLLIAPDQMYMQIHESIGHPLELDRILGDERNYAGWSFVQPSDFGTLQYGSKKLNVTFDPTVVGELASYNFDECGLPATKEYLIKDGLLLRGLGSLESQARSGLSGVANFRSQSWFRAPIDRMANINIEPGDSSLSEMIKSVEKGILMRSNRAWSIDDYRRKFQFGCELGYLIQDGELKHMVKNPNYRGISVPFWRNLKALSSIDDYEIYGSPNCGKGEPNQAIRVGHASPYGLFANIEVFGGIS